MKIYHHIQKIFRSNHFYSFAGHIFPAFCGFLNFIFLVNELTVPQYGVWVLYISSIVLMDLFRKAFSNIPVIYYLSKNKTKKDIDHTIGTFWFVELCISIFIILLFILIRFLFNDFISGSGFEVFIIWYPIIAILVIPFDISITLLQYNSNFKKIALIKSIHYISFSLFLVLNSIFFHTQFTVIIYIHILTYLISFTLCIVNNWCEIKLSLKFNLTLALDIFRYGLLNVGSFLGTALLKNTDIYLIGIFLSQTEVAIYSVPMKLVQLFELLLAAAVSVAIPKFAKYQSINDINGIKSVFLKYSSSIFLVFLPICIFLLFFGNFIINIIAGNDYKLSGALLKIFLIYILFIPFNRFIGVLLQSINKPGKLLIIIFSMVLINFIGDIFALYFFQSLQIVAIVTICNILTGIIIGWHLLTQLIPIKLKEYKYMKYFFFDIFNISHKTSIKHYGFRTTRRW